MNMHRTPGPIYISEGAKAGIAKVQQIWRSCLKRYGGPFLFAKPSLADCAHAPVVSRFVNYDVGIGEEHAPYMATITGWDIYRAWEHDALQETWRIERVEI